MTSQLERMRRVVELREDRAARQRRKTRTLAQQRAREVDDAARRHQHDLDRKGEAEACLAHDPADPQVQAWHAITRRRMVASANARDHAEGASVMADADAAAARSRHERVVERERHLGLLVVSNSRDRDRLRQDREDEDAGEANR